MNIGDVFTVLIHYLDNPDSDPTVSCVCVPVYAYVYTPSARAVTLRKTQSLADCLKPHV